MQRLIDEKIKSRLAEDILFGELADSGGTVYVSVEDGDIAIEIESRTVATQS
jgi:ATP-dependent Clp protease ATP-binding subunit ClpA